MWLTARPRSLIVHRLQDSAHCDLDPEYLVSDVFSDRDTVYVVAAEPKRRRPKPAADAAEAKVSDAEESAAKKARVDEAPAAEAQPEEPKRAKAAEAPAAAPVAAEAVAPKKRSKNAVAAETADAASEAPAAQKPRSKKAAPAPAAEEESEAEAPKAPAKAKAAPAAIPKTVKAAAAAKPLPAKPFAKPVSSSDDDDDEDDEEASGSVIPPLNSITLGIPKPYAAGGANGKQMLVPGKNTAAASRPVAVAQHDSDVSDDDDDDDDSDDDNAGGLNDLSADAGTAKTQSRAAPTKAAPKGKGGNEGRIESPVQSLNLGTPVVQVAAKSAAAGKKKSKATE